MTRFADMPIPLKLLLSILSTSVVVMLLMLATFFTYEFYALRQGTVRQITTLADLTAENSTAALAFQNQQDAQQNLDALRAQRFLVAAAQSWRFACHPISQRGIMKATPNASASTS
jgi:hypothetical protein